MKNKIYSGIYSQGPGKQTDEFIMDNSQQFADTLIIPFYLWETLAHNYMLVEQGIVPKEKGKKILSSLLKYSKDFENGKFLLDKNVGDVHENVENLLTKEIGESAGWMHTGRSRNDQSACDQKLITKKLFFNVTKELVNLTKLLLNQSDQYKDVAMPGFTHLRSAMISTYGFWLQSFADQFIECEEILKQVFITIDKNPLGAAASYGSNWNLNPTLTSNDLGFSKSLNNGLSALNSRGIHEQYLLGSLSVLLTIISRIMEDICIFSIPEINYISIGEEFTTGSSIMPQKINPDVAEKVRSKSAKLLGLFVTTNTAVKGTPSGYNRDSAETKPAILEGLQEVYSVLKITTEMFNSICPNKKFMTKNILPALATFIADCLVKDYKLPFRQAHIIIGKSLKKVDGKLEKITNGILEKNILNVSNKKIFLKKDFLNNLLDSKKVLKNFSYKGTPNPKFVTFVSKELIKKNKKFYDWVLGEEKKYIKSKNDLILKVNKFLEEK